MIRVESNWGDPEFVAWVRKLYAQARQVRGTTPAGSPKRRASAQFTQLIAAEQERGVPVKRMARALGVTHTALNLRLRRHGYEKMYPSQEDTLYGTLSQELADTCGRGHRAWTVLSNGRRQCRTCGNLRHQKRRDRLRRAPGTDTV